MFGLLRHRSFRFAFADFEPGSLGAYLKQPVAHPLRGDTVDAVVVLYFGEYPGVAGVPPFLVRNDRAAGGRHLPRARHIIEGLHVLEGVGGLRSEDASAYDGIEVHEPPLAQPLVQPRLPDPVARGEPAQRGDLVGSVVVDVRVRIPPEALFEKIEQRSECFLFLRKIVRPQRGELLAVPHTMEIFEPLGARFGIERVSFDVVEQITGIGTRHQIETFPGNTLPQCKGRLSRLSGVLQPRLGPQLLQRSIGEPTHPVLVPGKRGHGIDARRFELANLALHNTCGQVEAVFLLPCIAAMGTPSTKIAERTRDGTSLWRVSDEILKAIARETRIFGILRQPKANPLARAELDVRPSPAHVPGSQRAYPNKAPVEARGQERAYASVWYPRPHRKTPPGPMQRARVPGSPRILPTFHHRAQLEK